ncbi:hypothetical protein [Salinisphaera orenii]|uniref:hypothetical protein n=1 Tax=Salinisphaera orenii TaxID=856731 RepID=UPI000DBE41D6
MIKLMMATILTSALAFPLAYAGEQHESSMSQNNSAMHQQDGDMAKGMMGDSSMHSHMQAMRQTMQKIHQTEDPAERRQLMQKHMQQMQESMSNMDMGSKHQSTKTMDADKRRQMMQNRMQKMQGTMQQMMQQMQAEHHTKSGQ